MNKCLYCSKPCDTSTIFCGECRASLLKRQYPSPPPAPTQDARPRRIFIPTRARKVLIIVAIIVTILLLVDGVLFTTYALRQHSSPPSSTKTLAATGAAFSRHTSATAAPGMTNTPISSPASGSPTPGTGTGTSTNTPGTGKSWLQLSSPDLGFQYTQGQANPVNQSVTIRNGDGNEFSWQVNTGSFPTWLGVTPMQGNVFASGSGEMTVSVQATQLMPGMYTSQLSIKANSSTGAPLENSPQTLTISLIVLPPCVLQTTPAHLAFTTTLLQNPPGQTITLKAMGGCGLPVTWKATVDASWVQLSSTSGSVNGPNNSIVVTTHMNSMPGTYMAHITLSAVDSQGMTVQSNPQAITVTLTVTV